MPIEIMPDDAGLILADAYGAQILREASEPRMARPLAVPCSSALRMGRRIACTA
jgi:hypothetical protein